MKQIAFSISFLFIVRIAFSQPTISLTFDDGVTIDQPGYTFEQWNKMLLSHLDNAKIKAVFFVTGSNKLSKKGQFLLKEWSDHGHQLGNHTFTHPNFNSKTTTLTAFEMEVLRTDSIINQYPGYVKLFRFPYLKEGDLSEKIEGFRSFLKSNDYKIGYVTIDASDWYIDSRLKDRLKKNPGSSTEEFKKFYLDHLYERAMYYEGLSFKLTGRHIKHTLLLHHNFAAALFLGDLITYFKTKGWQFVDAEDAFNDPIFLSMPSNIPAGESIIWALAKESGKFNPMLRYPAEDGKYERVKMDKLGL